LLSIGEKSDRATITLVRKTHYLSHRISEGRRARYDHWSRFQLCTALLKTIGFIFVRWQQQRHSALSLQ